MAVCRKREGNKGINGKTCNCCNDTGFENGITTVLAEYTSQEINRHNLLLKKVRFLLASGYASCITLIIAFLLFTPTNACAQNRENISNTCGSKNVVFYDSKRGMFFKFLGFGVTGKIWKNIKGELASGMALAFWGPDNKKWAIMGPTNDYLWFTEDFSQITWLSNSSIVTTDTKLRILDRDGKVLFNLEFLKCE